MARLCARALALLAPIWLPVWYVGHLIRRARSRRWGLAATGEDVSQRSPAGVPLAGGGSMVGYRRVGGKVWP